MPPAPGSRLGVHDILDLIGAGGMGQVYRARDSRLNRDVAIKILPEEYAGDPERVGRFHREALAVGALNHPNIASIYDVAEADGTRYLVLELVEGETLADRLRRGPVPVDEALQIATQILEALEAAHEKGICHRDLKPANVKLTPDGAVKVLDFGLAKFGQGPAAAGKLTHSPTLSLATFPGMILGTAAYISPEAAKGYEADPRSDLFSFGCILYELLTGRQAFDGETASEILASVLKSEVDFTALPPRLNPRLVELLRRCLEKNPKKRWHAAADVRVEIESLIGRALVSDQAVAGVHSAQPLWKRALALGAAAAIGGTAVGYAAWTLKPEPLRPVSRFTILLPDDQRFTNIPLRVVALSPDGTQLVYVANNRLNVRPLASLQTRVIAGTDAGRPVLSPAFSPDGQHVAFWTDGAIRRISLAGGVPVTIAHAEPPSGLAWDEHGLLFGQAGTGTYRVPANGGTPELVAATEPDEIAASPQALPGGRAVLFSLKKRDEAWDTSRIVVQPAGEGERKVLLEGAADAHYLPTGHLVYASEGVIYGVPFDAGRLEVTGGPVPLVEGVRRGITGGLGSTGTGVAQASISRAGVLAYLPGPVRLSTEEAHTDLAIFDDAGRATPLKLRPRQYSAPRVSPDGRTIAVEGVDGRLSAVWIHALDGGTATQRLTLEGNNRAPLWTPDGQWITFQSDRDGDHALFRQRADGSGAAERLTRPAAGERHIPQSWSPDGRHLLLTIQREQGFALALMTGAERRVEPLEGLDSSRLMEASFSPDGRWFVYLMPDPGLRTFVEPFPRTGARFEVPRTGGAPLWTPAGDAIRVNATITLSALVAFSATPKVSFGLPQEFTRPNAEPNPSLSRRNFDFLPDGRGVVGVPSSAETEQDQPQILVVLNWFEELRARFAGR